MATGIQEAKEIFWKCLTKPVNLLVHLEVGSLTARQSRLIATACVERICGLAGNEPIWRKVVEKSYLVADGEKALWGRLRRTIFRTKRPTGINSYENHLPSRPHDAGIDAACAICWLSQMKGEYLSLILEKVSHAHASGYGVRHWFEAMNAEKAVQCDIIRSILRCPDLSPLVFDPDWRTPQVLAVAASVYDSRDFSDLPFLADALEDAGASDEILLHLRSPCIHVRGDWAIDHILSKELS